MKILIFVTAFVFSSTGISIDEFYPQKQALKMVQIALKEKDVEFVAKLSVADSLDRTEPLEIYKFKRNSGQEFYAVYTRALGRYDYFDYLIAVNLEFEVEKISILKYRSEHGGEIKSKKWLKQFENYSTGELRYKKEISALSGATISAKSMVADVPRVLKILKKSCD